jgi:hypothetical protein
MQVKERAACECYRNGKRIGYFLQRLRGGYETINKQLRFFIGQNKS